MSGFLDGLGVLGIVGVGLSAFGIVAKGFSTNDAINQEKKAVQLQTAQAQVQYQQAAVNNIIQTQAMVGKQIATAVGSGLSAGSGSLGAMVRNTYDVNQENVKNLENDSQLAKVAGDAKEAGLSDEKTANIYSTIGDIGELGLMAAMV